MDMVRLDPPAELTMPIGEAMFSQRATRRLDPKSPGLRCTDTDHPRRGLQSTERGQRPTGTLSGHSQSRRNQ